MTKEFVKSCVARASAAATLVLGIAGGLTAMAGMIALSACHVGENYLAEAQTKTQSVPLGGVKSARVHLEMGAGTLNVHGGATGLMDGNFTYSGRAWEPQVKFNASGDNGDLEIDESAEGNNHVTTGHSRNRWDVALNDTVPIDLHTELGAGNSDLSLAALSLKTLHVEVGAGEGLIDLSGNWNHDVDAQVEGGVGKVTIKLPRGMGVRATVEGGIGSVHAPDFRRDGGDYVNDAYGKSGATINLKVEGGVGTVDLELAGGPAV
jgi:hypothetical protein